MKAVATRRALIDSVRASKSDWDVGHALAVGISGALGAGPVEPGEAEELAAAGGAGTAMRGATTSGGSWGALTFGRDVQFRWWPVAKVIVR